MRGDGGNSDKMVPTPDLRHSPKLVITVLLTFYCVNQKVDRKIYAVALVEIKHN